MTLLQAALLACQAYQDLSHPWSQPGILLSFSVKVLPVIATLQTRIYKASK